jgi:hypothetical protein
MNHLMAKVIPFHVRHGSRDAATYTLALSARWQRLSKTRPWIHPRQPERLGNLLQRLVRHDPAIVFVIEKVVADIVKQLEGTS